MGVPAHRATFACEAGVLTIVTPQTEMRLRWQPEPLAEQRIPGGHWHPFIPEFRLLAPAETTHGAADPAVAAKYQALLAFRAGLPADLAAAVEPFQSHQWPLLRLLWASKPARDLVRGNAVLAFAVASSHEIRNTPLAVAADHAIRHCHQKQRQIAKWLGFPDSEAMVRLFRKVPVDLANPALLRLLRNAVATPEGLKMLGRLPTVNTGILHLLGQSVLTRLVTWGLILEVADSADERETASTGDALIEALEMLGDMLAVGTPAPFNSVRQVMTFREAVMREWQQREQHVARERLKVRGHGVIWAELPQPVPLMPRVVPDWCNPMDPLPPPPLPGTDLIQPILSSAELIEEGSHQHNCVGNRGLYEPHIRNGICYIYRVLAPERATLCIVRRSAHTWSISELKAACNRAVRPATRRAVRDWLAANQVSL